MTRGLTSEPDLQAYAARSSLDPCRTVHLYQGANEPSCAQRAAQMRMNGIWLSASNTQADV